MRDSVARAFFDVLKNIVVVMPVQLIAMAITGAIAGELVAVVLRRMRSQAAAVEDRCRWPKRQRSMSDPRVNVMASRFIPTVRFKRASTLWWLLFVGGPIVYGAGPWAISLLAPRYGWADYPGPWNLIGLIPVAVGTTGLIWSVALHVAQGPEAVEMELAKSYLLTRGPYAFSRHPTYLSILTLLFGWVIFYGSVAVFIAFVAGCAFFNIAARLEERALEARFGEAYLAYKNKVPRWFGKTRP